MSGKQFSFHFPYRPPVQIKNHLFPDSLSRGFLFLESLFKTKKKHLAKKYLLSIFHLIPTEKQTKRSATLFYAIIVVKVVS